MTTIQAVELGVLGPLQARHTGAPVIIPGAKPRAILTMLGLHGGSIVSAETLIDLLWGDDPPRTAAKALQTHISSLRRVLGDGFVLTEGTGWILSTTEVDAPRYKLATKRGRDAAAAGDTTHAVVCFEEALALWRGTPELPDSRRGIAEKTSTEIRSIAVNCSTRTTSTPRWPGLTNSVDRHLTIDTGYSTRFSDHHAGHLRAGFNHHIGRRRAGHVASTGAT